jgi:hypothetical protein
MVAAWLTMPGVLVEANLHGGSDPRHLEYTGARAVPWFFVTTTPEEKA